MIGPLLFKLLPPKVSGGLVLYAAPFFLILRYLFGSIFGALVLSVLLYVAMWNLSETRPLTFQQLILWLDALPLESKTAVVTSVLTIVGFLIAFQTATANWKSEAIAHLRSQVAGEIEEFFHKASRSTTEAQLYAESLLDTATLARQVGRTDEVFFKVRYAIERAPTFHTTRQGLSAMAVEIHRISGRHFAVLGSVPGLLVELEECTSAFAEITQRMWIQVPVVPQGHPDVVEVFIKQVDVEACRVFIDCCERNSGFINGVAGGVRGSLLSALIPFNLSSIWNLVRQRGQLYEALTAYRTFRR